MAADEPLPKERPPYDVGYGKPPKQYQFKKGHTGNLRGKPTGTKSDKTNISDILEEPVRIREGDRTRMVQVFEAGVLSMAKEAIAKKKLSATTNFIELCIKYGVLLESGPSVINPIVPKDWDLDEWLEMFEKHGPPPWPGERDGLVKTQAVASAASSSKPLPNSRGKKRGLVRMDPGDIVRNVANQQFWLVENGKRKSRSILELVLLSLRSRVAEGNIRAMRFFERLLSSYGAQRRPRIGLLVPETLTTEEWEERYARPKPDSAAE